MQGKVIARGTIRCGADELDAIRPLLAEHVRLSRAEPGNIAFSITPSQQDPCLFQVVEEFADRAAFAAHTERTRGSEWGAKSRHLVRDIRVYDRPDRSDVSGWAPPPVPPTDLVLDGRLVRLERLDANRHGADLHAANTATENWTFLPYGPFPSLASYRDWIDAVSSTGDPHFLAIVDKSTARAMGVASFLRLNPGAGSIEVGHINLSPGLQRHAGATEAMALMMGWAFEAGYRRYEWKCDAANARSRRAAERLGLSFEGVFRQALVVKGRNRDTAWFAAIDAEWPALRSAFAAWLAPGNFDVQGRQRARLWDLTAPARVTDDPARRD